MYDFKYDRVNSLAAHEAARQELAAQMAEFISQGGRVQYLANRIGEPPKVGTWNNSMNRDAEAESRRRGARKGAESKRAATPKGGTPQARRNNVLREMWA